MKVGKNFRDNHVAAPLKRRHVIVASVNHCVSQVVLFTAAEGVEQTGFPHDDKFRQAVTKAQEAMQELAMQTQYLAIDTLLRNKPKR